MGNCVSTKPASGKSKAEQKQPPAPKTLDDKKDADPASLPPKQPESPTTPADKI